MCSIDEFTRREGKENDTELENEAMEKKSVRDRCIIERKLEN